MNQTGIKHDVTARVFGSIPGHPARTLYESRGALSRAGVHRPLRAGISGSAAEGADSIVLSGGYEDDRDDGDVVVYTGQGGRDPRSGRQRSHQMLLRGSLALSRSRLLALPVRVVRGSALRSAYAPVRGYRYDGLYRVSGEWKERGRAGFLVWRFRLEKMAGEK